MERLYLILDNNGRALSQALLESPSNAEPLRLRLIREVVDDFPPHGEVQLIGLDDRTPARRGFIQRREGSRLLVQPTAVLGAEARENLRVQTNFQSVMYPVSGPWRGQKAIQGHDLSCGGAAFYTMHPLEIGEVAEMVLPVTDQPLLLHFKVLRHLPPDGPVPLYAARFVDLILDQEILIRKAVFSIQVSGPR